MQPAPTERTGVFVARAWLEEEPEVRLRVRIMHSAALGTGEQQVRIVATPDEVVAAVREWLDAFVRGDARVTNA
jgi:hypothetical protein